MNLPRWISPLSAVDVRRRRWCASSTMPCALYPWSSHVGNAQPRGIGRVRQQRRARYTGAKDKVEYRMPGTLTDDEVNAFLDSRPRWIILTTLGRDGYPHSVPIGYFRVGEDIFIGCRAGTQKLKNIERDPKVSLLLESGQTMADIKGVMIQGDARVVTEPGEVLELMRAAARARGVAEEQLPAEPRPGAAYIHVTRKKVISWD